MAATTWAEYKKHIEKDPALTRRFQVVQVNEPSEEKAILMMRGITSVQEKHHRVQILDEALEAAVKLSHRYIPARQLPDKSVSLLDTAAARVAISQHAVPPEVDDCRKRIEAIERESAIIAREKAVGVDTTQREASAQERLAAERDRLQPLEERWTAEKTLVDQILDLRSNGGGALDDAVKLTGLFIEKGPVVQVKDRHSAPQVYEDRDGDVSYRGPLVVLVNSLSASASEIVAAALQDYRRAVVIGGEHTFGKGTVQVMLDLDRFLAADMRHLRPLGAIALTVQKYYRITGASTQYQGVVPDVILPDLFSYLGVGAHGGPDVDDVFRPFERAMELGAALARAAVARAGERG